MQRWPPNVGELLAVGGCLMGYGYWWNIPFGVGVFGLANVVLVLAAQISGTGLTCPPSVGRADSVLFVEVRKCTFNRVQNLHEKGVLVVPSVWFLWPALPLTS